MQSANSWIKYKSGTDIRFDAVDIPSTPKNIDDAALAAIAGAFAFWLSAKAETDNLTIAVGHDSRISSRHIRDVVINTLCAGGIKVLNCGLCSTPSMFEMTQYAEANADGAIMITASHHPYNKNGLKFFTKKGGLEGGDIVKILDAAALSKRLSSSALGTVISKDFLELYCSKLINIFRRETQERFPLKGLKIVVDAGNGAGGFYVDRVLKPLGADTSGSQFLEPDGMFPNHVPNPENSQAMAAISKCVVDNHADLGIIFDTDVDRAALVAPDGKEINRNRLIALISAIVLEEQPGATIVTDSVTSDGLSEFIAAANGDHHRFKRGYKNVINEAIELISHGITAPLAIETSGHAAFESNNFLDDGAYLVTKILIKMCLLKRAGKTLLSLIDGLREPLETAEIRIGFEPENWREEGPEVLQKLSNVCSKKIGWTVVPKSYEGVRVSTGNGFFLVRMSVHDPIMPINIEQDLAGGVKKTAKKLLQVLKRFSGLELSALEKFCNSTGEKQ